MDKTGILNGDLAYDRPIGRGSTPLTPRSYAIGRGSTPLTPRSYDCPITYDHPIAYDLGVKGVEPLPIEYDRGLKGRTPRVEPL